MQLIYVLMELPTTQIVGRLKSNNFKISLKVASFLSGTGDGIWTHDTVIKSHVRYQLRYARIFYASKDLHLA